LPPSPSGGERVAAATFVCYHDRMAGRDVVGVVLVVGLAFLAGFVGTRFAGPFNPPLWAHTYTALISVVLRAS
jgi:hypothetical protein